jgi:hypothetical protein
VPTPEPKANGRSNDTLVERIDNHGTPKYNIKQVK